MVGTVVKENICELDEEVRAGCSIKKRYELTCVVQRVLGKKMFLVRFQDGCKKYISSDQLTILIVDNIL